MYGDFIVDDIFSHEFFFHPIFQFSTFNAFLLSILTKHRRNVNNVVITMATSNDIAFGGIGNNIFYCEMVFEKK